MDATRLQRLIDLGRSLVSELDLDEVLARVLETARELTGARYAALGIVSADGDSVERFVTSGMDAETQAAIGDLPRGRGVLGVLVSDPRPLRLDRVGAHPRSYGFPPGHPPMATFLGVPITVRGRAYGNLYLTEKESGRPFSEEDEQAVVVLADWAAIAIDNAHRHGALAGRSAELERAIAGYRATVDLARAVAGETDFDRIAELVAKRGRALVSARTAAVVVRAGDELVVAEAAGEGREVIVGLRQPLDGSIPGDVWRSRRTHHLHDIDRQRAAIGRAIAAEAGIYVPLLFRGRTLGLLIVFDRLDGPAFTDEDDRLLREFALSAAAALATAESALRRSIEASEAERGRWARELHDEALQQLGALRMLLASTLTREDPAAMRAVVAESVEHLGEAITELRRLITELRPAALDQLGAGPAIEALVRRIRRSSGLDIALHVDLAYEAGRVTARHAPGTEDALYRIVQEALTNVVKHGGRVRHVDVTVVESGDAVEVTVTDDGSGFDPEAAAPGFGLVSMKERAALAGGTLEVISHTGRGTRVHARLPVRRDPGGGAAQRVLSA